MSLDRIKALKILADKFEYPKDFNPSEYFLRPTYDFYREILSMGSNVEVLYPDNFRKDISDTAKEMMEIYFPNKM